MLSVLIAYHLPCPCQVGCTHLNSCAPELPGAHVRTCQLAVDICRQVKMERQEIQQQVHLHPAEMRAPLQDSHLLQLQVCLTNSKCRLHT